MLRRNILRAAASAAFLTFTAFGILHAAAITPEEIKAKGKISVGVLVDYPPFGMTDANNQPDGYDADVAKLYAERMGVDLEFVPVTSPNRVPYLLTGQVDILIASLGITPERAKQVQFSTPYYPQEVVVVAGKDVAIHDAADLSGKTIAVPRSATPDTAVTRQAPPDAVIRRFDDLASSTQALVSGQVEALGTGWLSFLDIEKIAPGRFETKFTLERNFVGLAVPLGEKQLLDWTNKFLADAIADGSLNNIYRKWVLADLPEMPTPDYVQH